MGLDWLDELGLLKRIIKTIAEDQLRTSVAISTERAEKKCEIARKIHLKLLLESSQN